MATDDYGITQEQRALLRSGRRRAQASLFEEGQRYAQMGRERAQLAFDEENTPKDVRREAMDQIKRQERQRIGTRSRRRGRVARQIEDEAAELASLGREELQNVIELGQVDPSVINRAIQMIDEEEAYADPIQAEMDELDAFLRAEEQAEGAGVRLLNANYRAPREMSFQRDPFDMQRQLAFEEDALQPSEQRVARTDDLDDLNPVAGFSISRPKATVAQVVPQAIPEDPFGTGDFMDEFDEKADENPFRRRESTPKRGSPEVVDLTTPEYHMTPISTGSRKKRRRSRRGTPASTFSPAPPATPKSSKRKGSAKDRKRARQARRSATKYGEAHPSIFTRPSSGFVGARESAPPATTRQMQRTPPRAKPVQLQATRRRLAMGGPATPPRRARAAPARPTGRLAGALRRAGIRPAPPPPPRAVRRVAPIPRFGRPRRPRDARVFRGAQQKRTQRLVPFKQDLILEREERARALWGWWDETRGDKNRKQRI